MSKTGEYLKQDCQYNNGCACTRQQRLNCEKCGWNPKVMERRNEEIQKKFKGVAQDEGV